MAEMTPMMKQYMKIKAENKDSILFFRLGDFYEMFDEDARTASRELDLTLTSRDKDPAKSAEEKIPMCGIPYHASDAYIARLIAKGYKVAICEQMEDPATAKGLVKRDIIRVVTPGTVIDAACLEDGQSNFLCGIFLDEARAGVAFCDMSTGKTHLTAFSGDERVEHLLNELGRFPRWRPSSATGPGTVRTCERPWRTGFPAGWSTAGAASIWKRPKKISKSSSARRPGASCPQEIRRRPWPWGDCSTTSTRPKRRT